MATKECIACAEQIQQNAKLCRYCRTDQNDPNFSPPSRADLDRYETEPDRIAALPMTGISSAPIQPTCSNCGAELDASQARCSRCSAFNYARGAVQQQLNPKTTGRRICDDCDFINPSHETHCAKCGHLLDASIEDEDETSTGISPTMLFVLGSVIGSVGLALMVQLGSLLTNKSYNFITMDKDTNPLFGLFFGGLFYAFEAPNEQAAKLLIDYTEMGITPSGLWSYQEAWTLWTFGGLLPLAIGIALIVAGRKKSSGGSFWFFFAS